MRQRLVWSDPRDAQIRRLRAEGASWDAIASILHVSPWVAIVRSRHLGALSPRPASPPPPDDWNREPLPAGHHETWSALTHGTLLEATPYPWPPLPIA